LEFDVETTCRLVIVDGLPACGRSTLTRALAGDLGVMPLYNGVPNRNVFRALLGQLENPEPLIIDTFHLTAAAYMQGSGPMPGDLAPAEWQLLDDAVARRFGRIIYLVDTPGRALERLQLKAVGTDWTAEQLGLRLQRLNQAFGASAVARKTSHALTQFIDPEAGEKTENYHRLIEVLRREMKL
jgi:hypothetical protein